MRVLRIAAVLSLLTVSAHARTWYVATNGHDLTTTAGTISDPFATISYICSQLSTPPQGGDTVYVRGGIYYGQVSIWISGSSTAGPIVFQNYPGEQPIFDGSANVAAGNDIVGIGGAYITFTGFEVRNSPHVGITGWGAQHVTVSNCIVHDSLDAGIWFGHDTYGNTHDDLLWGNSVYDNCLKNKNRDMSGWPQAIGISEAYNMTISHNRSYRNFGEGIVLGNSETSTISNNEFFDNYSANVYVGYTTSSKIDGNLVYTTGDMNYYRSSHPADGINLANEGTTTTHHLDSVDVIDNVVVGAHWGIGYWFDASGITNCRIANNTVYAATLDALHLDADTGASGNLVENNIVALPSGSSATLANVPSSGYTYRYNLWSSDPGSPAHTTTSNDQIGDPLFVKAGGHNAEDYKLTSTSPAIDHGSTLSYVTVDYSRKPRGGTYEMGAFEY